MDIQQFNALQQQVLGLAFGLAFLFGLIGQRSHFCTMGAVSDIISMGDWSRMRMWAMAAGVAMIGFQTLAYLGLIDPTLTVYASTRFLGLSALLGGGFFGLGMVLGSGCGSKTLIRIGGGSLKSLIVFVVMGVAAFATMKGLTAVWRVATVDRVAVDVPAPGNLAGLLQPLTGLATSDLALGLGLIIGLGLMAWALIDRDFRRPDYLLGGLGIGGLVVAMWWLTGHWGFVAEHPQTLEAVFVATNSGRAEAFSFVAPMAFSLDWLMFYSDKSKVLSLGVVLVVGVVAGSAFWSVLSKSFHWEGFRNTEDTALHLLGAVLMGVGGVTAMGCTVGQGLSGLSTLSLNSFFALAGIFAGSYLGLRWQIWRLERSA
ncbi:MAG: YeeE/YedE family protein [Betaproteobacteria bacterium]